MTTHVGACFWGYNQPGCFLWAQILDSGRVYVKADYKFAHRTIEDVAVEIQAKTARMGVTLGSIYAGEGMFPPVTETEARRAETPAQVFGRAGLRLTKIVIQPDHAWQRVHDFLRLAPDGKPWLVIHPDCQWLIRTLPTLVQTKTNPDDCEGEDYAAKALRILLSSRVTPTATPTVSTRPPAYLTLGWFKSLDKPVGRGPLRVHYG